MKHIYFIKSIILAYLIYPFKSFRIWFYCGFGSWVFAMQMLNNARLPDAPKWMYITSGVFVLVGGYLIKKHK